MRAAIFDGELKLGRSRAMPKVRHGWARIRVSLAGICRTDLEITKGYMGFTGVPGHEFVGTVDACDDPDWIGRRVVAEINAACGQCDWCRQGLGGHCPNRQVLGILDLDGCMAEYCRVPMANLFEVPESIPDHRAVFIEPLSAACEILDQVRVGSSDRVVVLGDGQLGIMCAWVMSTMASDVTLVGHHTEKMELAAWRHLKTADSLDQVSSGADIVVEATGSDEGLAQAIALSRPRGTIVLKSTIAESHVVDLAPLVINEQTIVGSRCGDFEGGFRMLKRHPDMPIERLITAMYRIENVVEAFHRAAEPDALKILVQI